MCIHAPPFYHLSDLIHLVEILLVFFFKDVESFSITIWNGMFIVTMSSNVFSGLSKEEQAERGRENYMIAVKWLIISVRLGAAGFFRVVYAIVAALRLGESDMQYIYMFIEKHLFSCFLSIWYYGQILVQF